MSTEPGPRFDQLETRRSLLPATFRTEHEGRQRPIRITGAIDLWPALGRWSPEDFATRFGDRRIAAYEMRDGMIALDGRSGFRLVDLKMSEYVRDVARSEAPHLYLRAALPGSFPELASETGALPYARELLRRENLWFSGPGTVTHLHFDLPHNLIAQIHGRKRFFLFAPDERPHLYGYPWLSTTPHLARVDLEAPDLSRFPRLGRARGFTCTLEAGDLLYIPPRWWHHARSKGASISVNRWWADVASYPIIRLSDAYKRLRGLNI